MKICLDELRDLYLSRIADCIPANRKRCPSPEKINACVRGSGSKREKRRLVEHITGCFYCMEEFQFVLETQRHEKEMLLEIERQDGACRPSFGKREKKTAGLFRIRERIPFHLVTKRKVQAGVSAAVLLIAAGTLYTVLNPNRHFRTQRPHMIKSTRPANNQTGKIPLLFRWKEEDGAEHYVVELFDSTLYPLWKSPKVYGNSVPLPARIAEKLAPGGMYFWFVTGFTADGQRMESPLIHFKIKK